MKTAIITGASRGIGKAIALQLAENGYKVIINYCNSKYEAEEIAKKIDSIAIKADVSKMEEVKKMVDEVIGSYKKIDLLVNNAGISVTGLFTDIPEETSESIFNINLKGTLNCSRAVLPYMIKRKTGKIINISSMWGQVGASCEVDYSTSKSAIIGFTKALAKEVGLSGITVNCVAPGVIDTQMNENLSAEDIESLKEETPLHTIGTPRDIAEAVCFLSSYKAGFITGQIIGVNGGIIM